MIKSRTPSLISFLRSVPVFGGLEGRSLDSMMNLLHEETFEPGAAIFAEGELGRTMYVVRDGEVEVTRQADSGRRVQIVRLGTKETFGEMTLVELQPRSATVKALRRTRCFTLTNLDLYNLYKDDNYAYVIVLQNICRMLSRRLRKADGRIVEFLDALHGAAVRSKIQQSGSKSGSPTRLRLIKGRATKMSAARRHARAKK